MFALDPHLQRDTIVLGRFSLSLLLLMNDRTYPWLILVPQRPDLREIFELTPVDRQQLLDESCHLAETLAALFSPDKLNIAALGNLVPQLHLHHVVRYRNDPAWPAPVWGKAPAVPYRPEQIASFRTRLLPHLNHFNASPA
ncbi:MAG: HIT domain-containing protein [Desulfuromonadales bacterium]|nr:HIT domain-containing protein [Desulfuromonadales bacterium]